jgi:UDP:flavonoid glycosyltransferase YjiC (YdhE family)
MRALFTTQPGTGMFNPLVPFARALQDAGHDVAFACAECFRPDVEAAGFDTFPAGLDWRNDRMTEFLPDTPPPGPSRSLWIQRLWRYTTARAMVPDLMALTDHWRPDRLVREGHEYGACLTSELAGVPHVVAGALWFRPHAPLAAPLDELRVELGLSPDPEGSQLYRYLTLAPMPPAWVAPDEDAPATTHFVRYQLPDHRDRQVPDWLANRSMSRPLVHATLGTTEVTQTPGLYEMILAGLRDEPVDLVVAVGRHRDPAEFGTQRSHVRIERQVDHGALLSRCDLVVTHGGFSTIMGCLAAGIPMVVIPVQGDQPRNAQRCADLGVGRMIGPDERTPAAIQAAVQAVLADPSYGSNAERFRDEIASLPRMDYAVELMERLASDRQPLPAGYMPA